MNGRQRPASAPHDRRQFASQIRSYVLRQGRLTNGQRRALDELWPRYGIDLPLSADPASLLIQRFGRAAPTCMEIGFGDGEALLKMAEDSLERNFIGVEVHPPGIGRLLLQLEARSLTNVRVFREDCIKVLTALPEQTLQAIHLYFPDPWPKKKHHKRRLMQPAFINLVNAKLASAGRFHFATDWQPYAEQALARLQQSGHFHNLAGADHFSPRSPERPLTKFERRGQNLGHGVWDVVMEVIKSASA